MDRRAHLRWVVGSIAVILLALQGAPLPGAGEMPAPRRRLASSPYPHVSAARMLGALGELTAIGADGLWRTSGSAGERQAFAWLRAQLDGLGNLKALGTEVLREEFRIPVATEVWEARGELEIRGSGRVVPMHALQGHREILARTLRFDTDGRPNDSDRNPVEVTGPATLIRTWGELQALGMSEMQGRVAVVDFAIFDRGLVDLAISISRAAQLLARNPAAILLVTSFSNRRGEAHGSFVGDVSGFAHLDSPAPVPTLYARIEDFAPAGIAGWSDLAAVTRVTLRLDADVFSPGESEYTCLRVPGIDSGHAVILGAHLDSPNSPGALDNGSGSVALLEAARVLDTLGRRPPVDTWLCWFGSHERGLYGSSVFVLNHQELADRTLGMLQVDCLGHATEGLDPRLVVEQWSYAMWGDPSIPMPEFVTAASAAQHDDLLPLAYDGAASDNASFVGFDVPNANLILMDPFGQTEVHVDNHLHDPYDTVELAAMHPEELEAMARAFLATALRLGAEQPPLRVAPPATRRAVVVASHTEQPHMTPTSHTLFGMALAWEGFDVDVIPYGQAVTAADLTGASLVIVLPVLDYPSAAAGTESYDEAWSTGEIATLHGYATGGGLLVLVQSAYRMRQPNTLYEVNEDWADVNALAAPLGVTFLNRILTSGSATVTATHELTRGLAALAMAPGNGRAISAPGGRVLATTGGEVAAALLTTGSGEVLALADLGMLGSQATAAPNVAFWHNLTRWARSR